MSQHPSDEWMQLDYPKVHKGSKTKQDPPQMVGKAICGNGGNILSGLFIGKLFLPMLRSLKILLLPPCRLRCMHLHTHAQVPPHTRAPARRHIRITDKSQRPPNHHADTRMTAHLLCLCMGKQAQGHLSERCGSFLNQGNLDSRESKKQVCRSGAS